MSKLFKTGEVAINLAFVAYAEKRHGTVEVHMGIPQAMGGVGLVTTHPTLYLRGDDAEAFWTLYTAEN